MYQPEPCTLHARASVCSDTTDVSSCGQCNQQNALSHSCDCLIQVEDWHCIECDPRVEGDLQQAMKEVRESKAALAAQAATCDQLSSNQARLQRQVELLAKERDSLKHVLTLYQEEPPKAPAPGILQQNK